MHELQRGSSVTFTHASGREAKGSVKSIEMTTLKGRAFLGEFDTGFGVFTIDGIFDQTRDLRLFVKCGHADSYIAQHTMLKRLGFPVPATMRKVDAATVAITDYRAQGVTFFGKSMDMALIGYYYSAEAKAYIDNIPDNITTGFKNAFKQIDEITKQLKYYTKLATGNGIILPSDEQFEVMVFPNGTWQLMLLDIHGLQIDPSSKKEHIEKQNKRAMEKNLDTITSIAQELETKPSIL